MMNTNKKTPKLRFKGFTDDWEQRKLGSLATVEMNKRIFKEQTTIKGDIPFYKIGTFGSDADSFISRELFKEYKNKYPYPNIGDILISASGSIGRTVVYNGEDAYYQDSNIVWLNHNGKIDNSFLLQFYNQVKWAGLEGSTIKRLYNKNILETNIALPKIEEQRLIGKFFELVDRSITLHQRKLEKLKLNKSALLQKLFPQKGCTIPDVRFKGFTDAWEQRKLNDFGIATGGTSIESEFVDGGTYKVINIGSYSEESVYNDQGLRVNKTDKTKSRILNKYDLTMILNDKTASGNIIGRVLLIDQDNTYVYNQRTERIEVDTKDFLPMFLYHMLNAPEQRKYIVKASQGNTQIYVNWSTISNIDYMIPQLLLEQEKIANLFSLINKDITLHQRKLDCLISIKKGLLQQLFV